MIDDNGPRVSVPHAYVVKAKDHQLDCDGADPSALDRLGRCFANMDPWGDAVMEELAIAAGREGQSA